jgi:hypothetical protein
MVSHSIFFFRPLFFCILPSFSTRTPKLG